MQGMLLLPFQDYTHVVMNWILTGKKGNEKDEEWLEYFDAVGGPDANRYDAHITARGKTAAWRLG